MCVCVCVCLAREKNADDLIAEKNAIGYADRQAYEGYSLQFADETKGIVELEAIDKWAAELASMLYTYRSIARSLPTVTGDEAHKRGMYAASFEVLHPAITRIKTLISFKERACARWTSNLSLLIRAEAKHRANGEAPIPCEALYVQLLNTLDMLAVLDALKDTKACLNNDFSTYKRAFQHCRADVPDQEQITTENNLLQPFLANQQTLLTALKTAVQRLPGHDAVLADMATLAIEHLESDWYLLPAEKHRLLRSAAHALWLLDSPDKKEGANAFSHKRIQRARFGRWFRRYPIVPMYGDMFANLQHILQRCPNFGNVNLDDFFATSKRELAQVNEQYDLTVRLPRLRSQVQAFTSEFASMMRTVEVSQHPTPRAHVHLTRTPTSPTRPPRARRVLAIRCRRPHLCVRRCLGALQTSCCPARSTPASRSPSRARPSVACASCPS